MHKLDFYFAMLVFASSLIFSSCKKNENEPPAQTGDLIDIPYAPEPYFVKRLEEFPELQIPEDNMMTKEGIQLGRMLFYDPILSLDSTMGCASCHLSAGAFTDNLAVSEGVLGESGTRSSVAVMNVGYIDKGLFWDGRSKTLEDLALRPVEDPVELHEEWPNVINKFKNHPNYPGLFRKAFGIEDRSEITKELAAKAIAQFMRTMIVGEDSRFYNLFILEEGFPSDQELRGYLMFFDASRGALPDAQCFHCHNRPLFTNNDYLNNGLDSAGVPEDFVDQGRGGVTENILDYGRFKTPTLWNVELTAPYMHDGRFNTLEEVLNHYASGGHYSYNLDPLISDITLDDGQKEDLIAFIKTLTDTTFINKPEFQNPFQ